MPEYVVSVQVIKTYTVTVSAEEPAGAREQVNGMTSLEIAEEGSLDDVAIDCVEVIGSDEEYEVWTWTGQSARP